ncbi:hypothetical protein CP083_05900 [Candidatus Bathyarchaeota archaeon B24-2]|nr:MAG: hypothetical protein CP083_05900 [Candidatus Bathyarchaeota archaeon B24-2]
MKFVWYTPTRYCQLDPVSLELGIKSCTAAKINMCIGPEGEVYPCQSYFKALGNILEDKWENIWNHPTSIYIRSRGMHRKTVEVVHDSLYAVEDAPSSSRRKDIYVERFNRIPTSIDRH